MARSTTQDQIEDLREAIKQIQEDHGTAIEELNRRTFKLNVEIEGLKLEAERRALITAALETRLEKLEQAERESRQAPKPEPELLRKIRAASPLAQRLQREIAELHARTLARFGSDEPDKRGSDE